MKSSLDEAIALLSKWKADKAMMVLIVSDGPPDDPISYFFSVKGSVTELSESWVEVSNETDCCRLRLSRPGTRFEYVESRDPRLNIEASEREDAERVFEGCLSVSSSDGTFGVFNVLRERASDDRE